MIMYIYIHIYRYSRGKNQPRNPYFIIPILLGRPRPIAKCRRELTAVHRPKLDSVSYIASPSSSSRQIGFSCCCCSRVLDLHLAYVRVLGFLLWMWITLSVVIVDSSSMPLLQLWRDIGVDHWVSLRCSEESWLDSWGCPSVPFQSVVWKQQQQQQRHAANRQLICRGPKRIQRDETFS